MTFEYFIVFVVTVFVASIIPGPTMLLALTHGVYHGRQRTLVSALGNVTVTFIQSIISVVGLGAVLATSETAFQIIKWGGAVYLVYMGINLFLASRSSQVEAFPIAERKKKSLRSLFIQSSLVTAANPKAILFFTSVFPQFIDPKSSFLMQASVLTSTCVFIGFICFMVYAAMGQKLMRILSKSSVSRYFKRILGGTFIGSGVALALSSHR